MEREMNKNTTDSDSGIFSLRFFLHFFTLCRFVFCSIQSAHLCFRPSCDPIVGSYQWRQFYSEMHWIIAWQPENSMLCSSLLHFFSQLLHIYGSKYFIKSIRLKAKDWKFEKLRIYEGMQKGAYGWNGNWWYKNAGAPREIETNHSVGRHQRWLRWYGFLMTYWCGTAHIAIPDWYLSLCAI